MEGEYGAAPTEGNHEIVKGWMDSHSYDNGLKLMEHSYQGNNFVSTFEKQLTRMGAHYKSRVVWAGDYADEEPGFKIERDGEKYEVNLYGLCGEHNNINPSEVNTKEYPFIVFDKKAGKYAGSTRFYDIQQGYSTTQLGFTWYGSAYQGTGLNRHCKWLLLQLMNFTSTKKLRGYGR